MNTKAELDLVGLKEGEINFQGQYAGFASRFLAFIIDFLILTVVITITGVLINQLLQITLLILNALIGTPIEQPPNMTFFISIVVLVSVYAIYYLFFWSFIGTTIGGIIMGIRMINIRGTKPSFLRCLIRFAMEFMLFPLLIIGSLWIFINSRRQAWYDRVAGTYVIYNWTARPDERFWNREKVEKYLEGKNE